ncbi:glycosyltransferase [Pontimonas salivibrio]|uniref:glycosyltransferase n=1 Tax=Pontimonas salivibrio TaxID=1159327 RepID=UPI001319FD34|nr:glycosyltransferase [Pontimonas salivibrio]
MALRIAHLSFSASGGAGTVATRLAATQRALGHDAEVLSSITGTLHTTPLAKPRHTLAAGLDQYVVKAPDFHAPVSLYRNRLSDLASSDVADADVIHLHWPHGLIDPDELTTIAGNRMVVWTLHDMAALTGGCHYSLGCEGFTSGCEGCPAVRAPWKKAITRSQQRTAEALAAVPHLRLASPSQWLATEASRSQSVKGHDVHVIPNPLPPNLTEPMAQKDAKTQLGIPQDHTVFMVSASNLDDPVKAARVALEAFGEASSGGLRATLLVVGQGGPAQTIPNVRPLGYLRGDQMTTALSASDYLVVPSLAENQPLAISEAQAMGVSLIARDATGLPEHTVYDDDAKLFSHPSELRDLFDTLAKASRSASSRQKLMAVARERFDPATAATRYLELYSQ